MTEREYIDATDIRALDCAMDALRHITPANQPPIEPERLQAIFQDLKRWRESISNALTVSVDDAAFVFIGGGGPDQPNASTIAGGDEGFTTWVVGPRGGEAPS